MHPHLRTAAFVLGGGLITYAISERAFWGRIHPDDGPLEALMTLAAYTAVVHLALVAVRRFAVADATRLLLVGALLGWVVEGVVVATVYEAPPFTIAWTSLAWHAPLSVVAAWHLLPRALRGGGWGAVRAAVVLGAALGGWSAFMATDAGAAPDPAVTALSSAVVCAVLAAGFALQSVARPAATALRPGRGAAVVVAAVAVWGALAVLPAIPWAPLVLAPLLWVVLRRLNRTTPDGVNADPLDAMVAGAPARRLGPLAIAPVVAAGACALVDAAGAAPALGITVATALTVAGTVLTLRALGVRRPRRALPVADAPA